MAALTFSTFFSLKRGKWGPWKGNGTQKLKNLGAVVLAETLTQSTGVAGSRRGHVCIIMHVKLLKQATAACLAQYF